jgi:hypothetical protein
VFVLNYELHFSAYTYRVQATLICRQSDFESYFENLKCNCGIEWNKICIALMPFVIRTHNN